MRCNKKEMSQRPRNRNQYCMSEVLALAFEALVPLQYKAVNGWLSCKIPGAALCTSSTRIA